MATQAQWTQTIQLAPQARSASCARDFVGHHLIRHDLRYLVDDVQLVVSELVTNSVQHARTLIDVSIEKEPFCVVLTVHDRSPAVPAVQSPTMSGSGGRGLVLVGGCSVDWGVDVDDRGGKSVWVLFGLHAPEFHNWMSAR